MAILNDQTKLTHEQMLARIAALEADNAKLKERGNGKISVRLNHLGVKNGDKVGKGNISVYGLGRFPVTLYASQWTRLLSVADEIKAIIAAGKGLATKEDDTAQAA